VSGRSGCRGPRRLQARNRPLAGSRPRASPRRPLQGFLALRAPRADRAARAGPSASPFARSPSSSRSAASPRSAISDCPDGPPPRFGEARGNEQRRLPMNRVLSGHQPVDALMNVLKREHVSYELILHRHTETAVAEAEALGMDPAGVAKTLILSTPSGLARVVIAASDGLDLDKARLALNTEEVELASETSLVRRVPRVRARRGSATRRPAGPRARRRAAVRPSDGRLRGRHPRRVDSHSPVRAAVRCRRRARRARLRPTGRTARDRTSRSRSSRRLNARS
jgi:Aminoacyl-tRNA editing domain